MHKMTSLEIANALSESEKSGKPIAPIAEQMTVKNLTNAYEIQGLNLRKRIHEGDPLVGRKIGLTSIAVQKQLGVDQPDFGGLLQSFQIQNNHTLHYNQLIQPKAEAELAVILKEDIVTPISEIEEAITKIDFVSPAIEIVDSRIKDWKISIFDTIADNASSAYFVLGEEKHNPNSINWETISMQLMADNQMVSEGIGSNCMGNPLLALKWLANTMIETQTPLLKGEVILTGALGPMYAFGKNEYLKAQFSDLGEVSVHIQ